MSLTQRIPELEAAPEPRESGVSASEGRPGTARSTPGSGEARFQLVAQAFPLVLGPYRA
jgi:hypothetical protein